MNSFNVKPKIAVDLSNKKKPFRLLNEVEYLSAKYCGKDVYTIHINKGYRWNGADILKPFWSIIGYSSSSPEILPASMVHDWLCEHKDFIIKDGARVSSEIFKEILLMYGVPRGKANVMATCVYLWQIITGGWN